MSAPVSEPLTDLKVVAFGGGHGLSASLAALRRVTSQLTAVVTVADDGGSSGRLRKQLGALPPGDLRMALAALAGDDETSAMWAEVAQRRFEAGELAGHPVGNLLMLGLTDVLGDPVAALDVMAGLVGAAGRVLPLSCQPLEIVADVVGADPADETSVEEVRGQVAVATTPGQVVDVRIDPPSAEACAEAVAAVLDADWIVFGPGSWFTSVIPHLLVSDMAKAIVATTARRLVTLNLQAQSGETEGFSPETHLEVLAAHAPDLTLDVVLAPRRAVPSGDAPLQAAARSLGAELVVAHLGQDWSIPVHHPPLLAAAYRSILTAPRGDQAWR
jgi:uncharacterized cofD-like protein